MDRGRIYEGQEGYAPGAYISADSPYRYFFDFHDQNRWLIIRLMMDGGRMIHFLN